MVPLALVIREGSGEPVHIQSTIKAFDVYIHLRKGLDKDRSQIQFSIKTGQPSV